MYLRSFIRKTLSEGLMLDEARVEHSDIDSDLALLIKNSTWGLDFTLYTPEKIYGHLGSNKLKSGNYDVGGVAAEYGYGPLMYELAMSYVYPSALMPNRDGDVRSGSVNVWNRFSSRSDVRKEDIEFDGPDFPEQYYEDAGMGEDNPGSEFMYTRYYYGGAKDILKRLENRNLDYIKSGLDPVKIDRRGNEYWMSRYD